jgi:putative transposase
MGRKPKSIGFWVGRLPHWEVEDGRYFVTLHLSGAIPAPGRARLGRIADELRRLSAESERERLRLQRRIFGEMERWLDRSTWNPLLAQKPLADMVASAIRHRHERGDWHVWEYVVMPTHVHLFCEAGSRGLKYALDDFKCWTGHVAAKLLESKNQRFWQDEWFDHWSRSDEEDERIVAYIRNNPVKAGLVQDYKDWPHGSWQVPPAGRAAL